MTYAYWGVFISFYIDMALLKLNGLMFSLVLVLSFWTFKVGAQFEERADEVGLSATHTVQAKFLGDKPHIMAAGIALGDVNGDMLEDVFFVTGAQLNQAGENINPNKLFIANQQGGYTEMAQVYGLSSDDMYSSGPIIADFDGDGWRDLLMGGISLDTSGSTGKIRYYKNQQGTSFIDRSILAGFPQINTYSVSAGDIDKDGDLDVTLTHWNSSEMQILWSNNGVGIFSDVTNQWMPGELHPYTFTAILANITSDSWLDLMVASDFQHSQYFHNTMGALAIQNSAHLTDDNGMGGFVGDYDNDGDLDWFVTSIYQPQFGRTGNRLYRNDGNGVFTDVSLSANVQDGGWGWGGCFADFNNDGWLDVFHTNGYPVPNFDDDTAKLFMNQGDGTFIESGSSHNVDHTGMGRAVVCFDQDHDGKLDILVNNNNEDALFYQNQMANNNHYLKIKLIGLNDNIDAIGARLEITSGLAFQQIRDVMVGNSFLSSVSTIQHFGLANQSMVNELKITWPNGEVQVLENLTANQLVTIHQTDLLFVHGFESK